MIEALFCGCVINSRNVKVNWCAQHNAGLPDKHQTEEYYH